MKKIITLIVFVGGLSFATAQSNYYNSYQNSITGVNWITVATDLLLNSQQTNQLASLNNRYPDYNSWNNQYQNNPNGWRTDRNREIQRILGPSKYKKFKNKNYKGQNPNAVYNRNKHYYKNKNHGYENGENNGYDNEEGHGNKNGRGHGEGHGKGHDKEID